MPDDVTIENKLSVYQPGVFIELNKMVFTGQTHLLSHYIKYKIKGVFDW
jgi:hypothetical protein